MQISRFIISRNASVLIALAFLLLTQFSIVRAEGYQISQNLQPNQILSSNYQLSPDGKYVVYQIFTNDNNGSQGSQLFSVDTATKSRKTLTPLVIGNGKNIGSFQILPNSQTVVFNASLEADAVNRSELYSIAIAAASPNLRKNIADIPAASQAGIYEFAVSPDSQHVVYQLTEQNAAGDYFAFLNRVAPNGGAITQLTPRTSAEAASQAVFTPDSSRIVYVSGNADGEQYKSVKLDATGRKTLASRNARIFITPDSARIVYILNSSPNGDGEDRLYSITLSGGGTRKQLSKTGESVFDAEFANGYSVVVYNFIPNIVQNYSPSAFGFVPADKSEESVSFDTGRAVNSYAVSPNNSSIIYRGSQQGFGGASQLYSLTYQNNFAFDQQISNAPSGQTPFLNVNDFKIAPDSRRVVFHAQQNSIFSFPPDLFSVPIANNPLAVKLDALPGETGANADRYGTASYFITPDSRRVIFGYSLTDGSCCGDNLYTNSITGGTPPPSFAGKADDQFYQSSLRFTADGRRVIYTKSVYDVFADPVPASIWAANVPQ